MPSPIEITKVLRRLENLMNDFENITPLEALTSVAEAVELLQDIAGEICADEDDVDLEA
jgi:hypothetical protein